MGCYFLFHRIFLTQGSNPRVLCLLHCRRILYPLNHQRSPLWHLLNHPLLFSPAMITIDLICLFPRTGSFHSLPLLPFLPCFNPPTWNFETIPNHTRIKPLPSLKNFRGSPVLPQTIHKLFLQAVTNNTPHFPNTALLFLRALPLPAGAPPPLKLCNVCSICSPIMMALSHTILVPPNSTLIRI